MIFYTMPKNWVSGTIGLLTLLTSFYAAAGGVGVGATRVIYPAGSKQISLSVNNTDENHVYLIQSWIERADSTVDSNFIITPPLFQMKKKSENTLRLIYTGPALATDKETLFWVNVKAIPAKNTNTKDQNTLQLAVVSRIKLFYRPSQLPMSSFEAPYKITSQRQGHELTLSNPTPYFVNLVKLKTGSAVLPNTMLPPGTDIKLSLPAESIGELSYHAINDYGASIKIK